MPYVTSTITLKWFLIPFLFIAPNSSIHVQKEAVFNHSQTRLNYSKYNELTNDIPSSKDLIILNKKMDNLCDRVEELEKSLDTIK